ncbi:MAG: hypothetical protein ACE14P_06685 [Methanotrichaceae archaeon]
MACISRRCITLIAIYAAVFFASGLSPNIELAVLPSSSNATNVAINAHITDSEGDLTNATIYVIDAETHDVLWEERKTMEGSEANLSFIWQHQAWRVTNGTNFVEPVLALNTIGMPANETPYLYFSAPCILRLTPNSEEITALAFFGQNGEFNSLTDLSGKSYYNSIELMRVISPNTSYGRYILRNISLIVGETALTFLDRNIDAGLIAYPPMILSRSPIQHYTLSLEKVDASSRRAIFELDAEDSNGNIARKFWNESIDNIP